jgi:hypothetical protein
MAIQKYTIAEFRKATREAFNNAEAGQPTFISRHGKRYELRLADVQSGKQQFKHPFGKASLEPAIPMQETINEEMAKGNFIGPDTVPTDSGFTQKHGPMTKQMMREMDTFPPNGDPFADALELDTPKKNIADADASIMDEDVLEEYSFDTLPQWGKENLLNARAELKKALAAIDIDTQDPDLIERGGMITGHIEAIDLELKKR